MEAQPQTPPTVQPAGARRWGGDHQHRIVGLGGSLRVPSSSLSALRVALDAAASVGARVEVLDVRDLDLPPYQPEGAPDSPGVDRLVDATSGADAMIWSSPLYHGSVSGAFKNALDWLQLLAGHEPPFLTAKPVGLIAVAGGVQGLQAINTMEFVVRALRGWTVPWVVPIASAYQAFSTDGKPRDPALRRQLTNLGLEVAAAARRFAA